MSWSKEQLAERLNELQRDPPERCDPSTVRMVTDTTEARVQQALASPEAQEAFTEHLSHFVAGENCVACDWPLALTFGWGFAHGSGSCGECGWPVTTYHYVGEGEKSVRLIAALCAHPLEVSFRD